MLVLGVLQWGELDGWYADLEDNFLYTKVNAHGSEECTIQSHVLICWGEKCVGPGDAAPSLPTACCIWNAFTAWTAAESERN